MIVVLSLIITLLLSFLLCFYVFKDTVNLDSRFIVNLFVPIGIGVSSVVFISLNLMGLPFWMTFLVEGALMSFLVSKINRDVIKTTLLDTKWLNVNALFKQPILLLVAIIYFYAWLMDAGIFFFDSIKEPHGLWDAWNYWNLKAKFISSAPSAWQAQFHQMVSEDFHVDYPLLQSGFIARCWLCMKDQSVWVPIVLSFVFTFCTIGLLYSAVSFFINKTRGLVAGLIMLCTPFFMVMGDSQYADNTVGYFYLATIVLLTFARYTSPEIKPKLLIAAGVTAGLSAWSKNEGLLFITCLFISQLTGVFFKNYKELAKEIKYLLFGVIPILVLIMYFKTAIAPPNDIVKAQGESTLIKLTDLSRYTAIGGWFAKTLGTFGKWFMNPWWLFLVGIIYKGVDLKNNKQSIVSNFVLICLMTIGFFFVYVITPLELEFHLSTSIHRLFFQLFPSFIFLYFIAVKTRENG
jgi:hypothetical protein